MPPFEIRNVQAKDLDDCAELLAARHRRDMARLAHLEPALAEASGCRSLLEGLLTDPRSNGMVATAGGRLVGFLFGQRMLLSPTDFASNFVPPHSVSIPVEGHAVAEEHDTLGVSRALYAELAGLWTDDGFFTHRVSIPAADPETQEAWLTLGFGRRLTAATRLTATPVEVRHPRAARVERASPEDIDDVMSLVDEQNAWHWRSPIFWPVLREAEPAARAFNLNSLRSGEIPYFVAYEDGRPAGMQTFLRPGFTPPIVKAAGNVYLFEGVVASDARGGGIGGALLQHSMAWASREGFETCTLHFASGNPLGAPFWLGHGFVPVEHSMQHVVDDRIAWGRPKR